MERIEVSKASDSDDLLHNLNFKIKFIVINEKNELYLIKEIKKYRAREDINQYDLEKLHKKFIRRFSKLHEIDEHSPINFKN